MNNYIPQFSRFPSVMPQALPTTCQATRAQTMPFMPLSPDVLPPIQNLVGVNTSQIENSMPKTEALTIARLPFEWASAVGSAGNDTLSADLSSEQLSNIPSDGYYRIDGAAGDDTLVFSGRFIDYDIEELLSSQGETAARQQASARDVSNDLRIDAPAFRRNLTESETEGTFNRQPSKIISGIERFQFADITLNRQELTDPLKQLAYYRQYWSENGPKNYELDIMASKFVPNNDPVPLPSGAVPVGGTTNAMATNRVINGVVTSDSTEPLLANLTVESLFDILADEIALNPEKTTSRLVSYGDFGVPIMIFSDRLFYMNNSIRPLE